MKTIFYTGFLAICWLFGPSLYSHTFQINVQKGYSLFAQAAEGDTLCVWSGAWGALLLFSHRSEDTKWLETPVEWTNRIIMPAHDAKLEAQLINFPTGAVNYLNFEMIRCSEIIKLVQFYFHPVASSKLVVLFWYDTGGNHWERADFRFEKRQLCNYLASYDIGIVFSEREETTWRIDIDGNGKIQYNFTPDSINTIEIGAGLPYATYLYSLVM